MGNRAEKRVGLAGKLIVAGRFALGLAAPVAVIGAVEACGGGDNSPSDTGQKIETPRASPSQTAAIESPSPTVISTPSPEPTPSPTEIVKEQPCTILPDKFCSQAEAVKFTYQGQQYKFIGIHLPAGIPIQSPFDGSLGKADMDQKPNTGPFHGFLALVSKPNDPSFLSFSVRGDLQFDNMLSLDVKKGDVIAYTQDTGIKNLGDYNIIVTASQKDPNSNGFITDEDMLKTMFPQAFNKPIKQGITYEGPSGSTNVNIYQN